MFELTLDDRHNSPLLNSRRAFETVRIDAAKEFGLQIHRVEGVGRFIVIGLDLS